MKALCQTHFIRPLSRLLLLSFVSLVPTGCTPVGPDYSPPESFVSHTWHSELEGGLTSDQPDPQSITAWWTTLNDPKLSELIDRAVASNLDLKQARSRIRQSRAERRIARADLFPLLDIRGSDTWTRSSEDMGTGKTTQLFSAAFDSSWELDIFGGVRRSVEAADADLQAVQENLRDVLVSLVAEVALNYVELRTYQARLAAAQANLQAQTETNQLTDWMSQAGLSDELAVQQARYNLESTRSEIPLLRAGLEETMNRIAVLLGEQPGAIHEELTKQEPIPVTPAKVVVGVPADVLRRRPDVRQAERELAAQTARIGVATADLYPRFSLSGSIGIDALSFDTWLRNFSSLGDWTLSGGPSVTWRAFDAGTIRQNIEVQSALQEQALFQYETAVLGALEEVENALVSYAEEQVRRESLREATKAAERAVELAVYNYQAGRTDFSNVLDAQRSLLSFQDQLAQSDGTVTSNLIRLYKALGGGWSSLAFDEKLENTENEKKT
ncbi:MAG: efflux transporter outer membrane subunit [Sedimentisphaerales bacterium]|nr:efflux transporter outer membrane subunit [Sedimentisphaerales bacterium]